MSELHPRQNRTCGKVAGSIGCLEYTAPDPHHNPCFACAWWDDFCAACEPDDDDDGYDAPEDYDTSDPYDKEYDCPF
jgi:hypothetical protein